MYHGWCGPEFEISNALLFIQMNWQEATFDNNLDYCINHVLSFSSLSNGTTVSLPFCQIITLFKLFQLSTRKRLLKEINFKITSNYSQRNNLSNLRYLLQNDKLIINSNNETCNKTFNTNSTHSLGEKIGLIVKIKDTTFNKQNTHLILIMP